MARLVYMDPEGRQQTLDLSAQTPQIVIGRHPDCDLVSDDTSVSRRHCIISHEGGHYRVADLGSANGTQVNESRVTRRNLVTRDIVRCGNLLLQFFDEPEILTVPPAIVRPVSAPPPPVAPPPPPRAAAFAQGSMTDTSAGTSVAQLMRAEITRLQERIRGLESANAGQAERLGELQRELAVAGGRVDAALGHASEAESEAHDLRAQLWRAEEQLRARVSTLEAREGELDELRRRLEVAVAATPASGEDNTSAAGEGALSAEEARSLAEALAASREQVTRLEAENAAAQARVEHLTGAVEEADKVRGEAETLRSRLAESTAELNARKTAHRTELASLDARLKTADDTLLAARDEAAAALRAVNERLGLAERQVGALETALAEARSGEERGRSALATLEASLSGTEQRAAEAQTALAARTSEAEALRSTLAETTRQLEAREAALSSLRDQLTESEAARTALLGAAAAVPAAPTPPAAAGPGPGGVETDVSAWQARAEAAEAALEKMRADRLMVTSARAAEVAGLRVRLNRLEGQLATLGEEKTALETQLASARTEVDAHRAMAVAARRQHADDSAGLLLVNGAAQGELEQLRVRAAQLEATVQAAEEREAEREAHLDLLTAGRARADRALQEREAAQAAAVAERAEFERTCDQLRMALDEARAAADQTAHTLEEMRREESQLRGALAEARDEVKAAGQVRRTLRETQSELERLKAAWPGGATPVSTITSIADATASTRAFEVELEKAQSEARSARERLAAMETRIRRTEIALAEAEGRAQEAQTALLQVREAERAARDGAAADRSTSERMKQMNVKLAAVTRRAQLAEEQASAARRLEERTAALETELAAVTRQATDAQRQIAEAEAERDTAATTTLTLLAEKRALDLEIERLKGRLADLEAAADAAKRPWPTWIDDHLDMLSELIVQFRGDMAQLNRQWSALAALPAADDDRRGFQTALESARAGADSLAEATAAAHEAIDSLRREWGAGSDPPN